MITDEEKQRIEKEADKFADSKERRGTTHWIGLQRGYVAGGISEHELLKPQLQYSDNYIQMLTEDRDKLAKQLNEVRNKGDSALH